MNQQDTTISIEERNEDPSVTRMKTVQDLQQYLMQHGVLKNEDAERMAREIIGKLGLRPVTGQILASVLQQCKIVDAAAIDDPEGYDNYKTLEAINRAASVLLINCERDDWKSRAEKAERCCAEMRDIIQRMYNWEDDERSPSIDKDAKRALSSDCGKDYVPRSELDAALKRVEEAELRLGNWSVQHELDETKAKLSEIQKSVCCIYCNEKYTAEEKDKLADHIMTCEKSPLVQLNREIQSKAIDLMDMTRDEFIRVAAISDSPEILGICSRSQALIDQKYPVIKQRDEAIKDRDAAKAEVERLREQLESCVTELTRLQDLVGEVDVQIIEQVKIGAQESLGKEGA